MFLNKYGVARHIYIPVIKRGVVDFAVSGDWTPVAGDVKISKDGGAAANVTNLPTAITMGNGAVWDFSLTATELQAAQVVVTVVDAVTKAVEDQSFIIETYGNASAEHAFDLGTATVSLSAGERNSVADALLDRDMSTGTDSGTNVIRTVRQALRTIRNKWLVSAGSFTVFKEDDSTISYHSNVSSDASANPITGSAPVP